MGYFSRDFLDPEEKRLVSEARLQGISQYLCPYCRDIWSSQRLCDRCSEALGSPIEHDQSHIWSEFDTSDIEGIIDFGDERGWFSSTYESSGFYLYWGISESSH